jgi:serine/threonine protein kinase
VSEASRSSGRGASPARTGRVGTVVNGKWHIDGRIGSGGMATVYAATHRNGHKVALKMLHTQLSRDESTRARFLREGYVANAVGHHGVVHVQDDGVTEDGCAFLVLDLLEGENIETRRIRLGGALPVDEVLEIADQALDALGAAHDKGIVHRDVKPDNVFLCNDGRVKLLDFGLARMKSLGGVGIHGGAESTGTGVTLGTPEFMPPEQAKGRRDEVDARSDVWGFGATLFTAITGQYVHAASTLHEQLIASATLHPRSIRGLSPHVPASVAVVIDRALELSKNDRWQSARDMQRALRGARAPRGDSDRLVAESLTMPAASMRRPDAPRSGLRPSSALDMPQPSSDQTLRIAVDGGGAGGAGAPMSDPTIEEKAPPTEQMLLESLPSSGGPQTPPPHTERITGTRAAPPRPASSSRTTTAPTLARSGSGPYAAYSSAPPAPAAPAAPAASHVSGAPAAPASPSAPPWGSVAPPGPASMAAQRSSSAVVIASIFLILASAAVGAWVLLHQ